MGGVSSEATNVVLIHDTLLKVIVLSHNGGHLVMATQVIMQTDRQTNRNGRERESEREKERERERVPGVCHYN